MSYFLYCIPDAVKADSTIVKQVDGLPVGGRQVVNFQGGLSGYIFAGSRTEHVRAEYKPQEQLWRNAGAYWVGVWKNNMPTEESLRRDEMIGGHRVKLLDGAEWLVPVARDLSGGTRLPSRVDWGENGELITRVRDEYWPLCSRVGEIWQSAMTDDGATMTDAEIAEVAVMGLAVNYRIGIHELGMLGVLDTQNMVKIVQALWDWPTWEKWIEAEKKTNFDSTDAG